MKGKIDMKYMVEMWKENSNKDLTEPLLKIVRDFTESYKEHEEMINILNEKCNDEDEGILSNNVLPEEHLIAWALHKCIEWLKYSLAHEFILNEDENN